MLFAIDERKVEELRKSSEPRYTVTVAPGGTPVALTAENYAPSCYDSIEISSTITFAPIPSTSDARQHLMEIRKRIEESGEPLKSVNELAAEIEARRSRLR